MRLLKPSWVSHDGNPIFSIDIHPDGTRLATGGQGEDSGRVVIWNMAPISSEDDEKDSSVPKMLCQMDNHLACVNCVRWSNNGKYLASGGDDKVIMIWQTGRYGGGSTVFGSGGKVNVEQWRCVSTLRGHTGDILDLAWSPHDAWLASCSVDNTVVVWNAVKFPETLSVLRGHSGLVKGVSWDPVGKYLASQSDDKSLLVWRTVDWQQETNITEPFDECGGTTHVLRLSWSPDGQYLVSAHAMNNSGPTAQIIERDGWKTEKDFVGHRKAITVAKFNPNILSKINKENSKMQHYCCCAIGSRDRSLSIWLTALKRPLVVIHDLFANSVLDVSWSRRGHQLTVCSWDGTVAYIDFSEDEIGRPLSQEEQSSLHQKMYGKSLAMIQHSDSMTTVIENPEMLRLKEQQQENNLVDQQQQQEKAKTPYAAKGPINKQIETRTADGRRRITPMFIAPAPDLGDAPLPFNSKTQPTFSSSTESKSKIIIEKRDEIVPARSSNSNTNSNTSNSLLKDSSNLSSNGRISASVQNSSVKTISQSSNTLVLTTTAPAVSTLTTTTITTATAASTIATIGSTTAPITSVTSSTTSTTSFTDCHKNGVVAASSTPLHTLITTTTTTTTVTSTSVSTVSTVATVIATTTTTEPTKPMPVEKLDKLHEKAKDAKQQKTVESSTHLKRKDIEDVNRPFKRRPGRPPLSEKLVATAQVSPKQPVKPVSPAEKAEHREVVRPSHSSFHLPPLKPEKSLSLQVPTEKPDSTTLLELDNNVQASVSLTLHKLKCVVDGSPSWEVFLLAKGIALAASSSFVAVACEDNSLSVFTMTGQRMFPSIILPSAISRLICNDNYIMILTTKAHIYVWDLKNQRNVIKNESLHPIMTGGPSDLSIVNSSLTDNGFPIIGLSTGKAYVYSSTMACWMLVSNADDIIQQCSDHVPYMPAQTSFNGSLLPLASLQAQGKKPSHQACRLFRSLPSMQQTGTLSYLDAQLAAALSLHSSKEYKFWLLTLIRYMAQEGLETRIREVCNNLLGPVHKSKTSSWEAYILGLHKHDLLQEILPIIGSNLRLQRLFTEYQEQLDLLKS